MCCKKGAHQQGRQKRMGAWEVELLALQQMKLAWERDLQLQLVPQVLQEEQEVLQKEQEVLQEGAEEEAPLLKA